MCSKNNKNETWEFIKKFWWLLLLLLLKPLAIVILSVFVVFKMVYEKVIVVYYQELGLVLIILITLYIIMYAIKYIRDKRTKKRHDYNKLNLVCDHGIIRGVVDRKCQICLENINRVQRIENEVQERRLKQQYIINSKRLMQNEKKRLYMLNNLLPENIKKLKGREFEIFIGNYYQRAGYDVRLTSAVSDGGYDLVIKKENQEVIIECKGYTGKIGRPMLQQFYGTVISLDVSKGIFITTSAFTKEAIEFVKTTKGKIELVNNYELNKMLNTVYGGPHIEYIEVICTNCGEQFPMKLDQDKTCDCGHYLPAINLDDYSYDYTSQKSRTIKKGRAYNKRRFRRR